MQGQRDHGFSKVCSNSFPRGALCITHNLLRPDETRSHAQRGNEGDLKLLQGDWITKDDAGNESKWNFKGDKVVLKAQPGDREYTMTIKLDDKANEGVQDRPAGVGERGAGEEIIKFYRRSFLGLLNLVRTRSAIRHP